MWRFAVLFLFTPNSAGAQITPDLDAAFRICQKHIANDLRKPYKFALGWEMCGDVFTKWEQAKDNLDSITEKEKLNELIQKIK